MNDKIRELAEQVDIIKRPNMSGLGWDYTLSENQLEKFAEVIIRECCRIVNIWTDEDLPEGREDVMQTIWIKKTFGIEE